MARRRVPLYQTSRPLFELSSILLAVSRSSLSFSTGGRRSEFPAMLPYHDHLPPVPPHAYPSLATLACLLLATSLALMIGGSITFLLGFVLMPWVLGVLILFYLGGIVSNLSGLGKAILFPSARSTSK